MKQKGEGLLGTTLPTECCACGGTLVECTATRLTRAKLRCECGKVFLGRRLREKALPPERPALTPAAELLGEVFGVCRNTLRTGAAPEVQVHQLREFLATVRPKVRAVLKEEAQ